MIRALTLQRLRFWTTELREKPSIEGWNRDVWEKKGRLVYWEKTHDDIVLTDSVLSMKAGQAISSDTFFNAFFLAHWLRLTTLQNVALRLNFEGTFELRIFLHSALQGKQLLAGYQLGAKGERSFRTSFNLSQLKTGLRISFVLKALQDSSAQFTGGWETEDNPPREVSLAIGMATFNRQDFALRTIHKVLDDPALRNEKIFLWVIDQSDVSHLEAVQGPMCQVIRQKNLGGSGGFTRAIVESVFAPTAVPPTHVLLMDDDSELEADSLLRVIRFSQFCRNACILGGTMLDLYRPQHAQALAETFRKDSIDQYDKFQWIYSYLSAADVTVSDTKNVVSVPADSNYAGWWFCLYPTEVFLKVGLPFPCFLKGDDVEFGSRAHRAGYAVYTLPGVGLWHSPFYAKLSAWTRYFETYNYLILNSLEGPTGLEDRFHSYCIEILGEIENHNLEEATAMILALEDFCKGWGEFCTRTFPDRLLQVRKELAPLQTISGLDSSQGDELKQRLASTIRQFNAECPQICDRLVRGFPLTLTVESWIQYFERGNLSHLPKSPPI